MVTTLHGTDITLVGSDRSYLPITRFAIEQSDAVTAISEYLRQKTLTEFGISRPIEVISNFVNCDVFHPQEEKSHRQDFAPHGEKILVHLSNFRPVKRVTDVVEIFARVRKEIPAKLMMIGDGPDRTAAEWMARDKSLTSDILFLGKQNQVQDLLCCADVRCCPATSNRLDWRRWRPWPARFPAICSNVGGLPEVIQDGVEGFLVPPRDVHTMAARALDILTDPDRHRKMGEAGRKRAHLPVLFLQDHPPIRTPLRADAGKELAERPVMRRAPQYTLSRSAFRKRTGT